MAYLPVGACMLIQLMIPGLFRSHYSQESLTDGIARGEPYTNRS